MSNCSLPGFTHRSGSSTVNDWLQSLVDLTRELITVRESIHPWPAIPWCPITVYQTSRTVFVWTFPVSFPNCSYRSWSRHQIIDRSANPSSLIRYGQEGWYPRRGPTTRLAALDAERIPNRKGTSRCVNDDPAPGQGWPREGECGLPSLALWCLDPNSRSVLRCRFGWRNKDSMSLDCVALVHPTLLLFIEY